jgi:hypothetical protein
MLMPKFDEPSHLKAEVQVIGSMEEATLADQLFDDLSAARGSIEAFAPADGVSAEMHAAQATRKNFMAAARSSLRVDTASQASGPGPARKVLSGVYGAIVVAAIIATWNNGGPYVHSINGFFINFWRETTVTSASRFITADILMFALAAAVLMVVKVSPLNLLDTRS